MNQNKADYDYKWDCPYCDNELKVETDVNGKCDKCNSEYEWDFDCEYEGAVYIPVFKYKTLNI